MKKDLKFLGNLFGQKLYVDMTNTDPRVLKYCKDFLDEQIKNADSIRKIKDLLNGN